nr:hypothetical protein [uncultured Olsenella sp.]
MITTRERRAIAARIGTEEDRDLTRRILELVEEEMSCQRAQAAHDAGEEALLEALEEATDGELGALGLVRLPTGADGVPWRVGDVVRRTGVGGAQVPGGEVTALTWHGGGSWSLAAGDLAGPCEGLAHHVPEGVATPAGRLRAWAEGARSDGHMDLRELDAIADELDGGR